MSSDHDYYKKQEEQSSNSFQRARRRSIELIESIEGRDHTAPTQSSRRKSVDYSMDDAGGDDAAVVMAATQALSHADAAKAAAEWFEARDTPEEAKKKMRNRNNASRTRSPTPSPGHSPVPSPAGRIK